MLIFRSYRLQVPLFSESSDGTSTNSFQTRLRHFPGLFCFLPGGVLGLARWRTRLGLLALQLVLVRSTAGASLCGRGKEKSPFFIRLLRWEIISLDHRISHNIYNIA